MPEIQVDPLITSRPSPPKTKIASQVDKPVREVHAVLAGKGGIGKTLVPVCSLNTCARSIGHSSAWTPTQSIARS